MILGDMNFECNTKNTGYNLFLNLCNDINIGRADLICGSDIKYTYLQDSTGKNSIIDHIFVSSRLVNDILEYTACESIVNLSDHLPVACNLAVPVQMIDTKSIHEQEGRRNNGSRRWDKGDLALYYNVSYEHLSKIHVPFSLLNNSCDVFSCVHWACINDYYRAIVTALQMSMNECIPVLRHGALKPYWCEELQELKKASIDAYNLWMLCDRPRGKIVNKMRIESKYKYKHALRAAGRKDNLEFDDKLQKYT